MKMKEVVVVGMCMVMLFGQAMGRFDKCYGDCYLECMIEFKKKFPYISVTKKYLPCAWKCMKKCIFGGAAASPATTQPYFCSVGCSIDSCAESFDDPTNMTSCVNQCSMNVCNSTQPT